MRDDHHWYDMRTDSEVFTESEQARDEWDAFHAYESDTTVGDGDPDPDEGKPWPEGD